jgi:thiamine biosynthesis lipoprotein
LTKGVFTPLVGTLLSEAGYDSEYSLNEKELSDVPALPDVVEIVDPLHINLKQPALFDFGAIGKGYLIDKVVDILRNEGLKNFTVDAGGDIVHQTDSEKKISVGLEHPDTISKVIGTVMLRNEAICGSAGNRRKWGRFHHIINPKTKKSPVDVTAVWVITELCAVADGLSTALFFVEPEVLLQQFTFEYIIIKNGRVRSSKNLTIELF